VLAPVLTTDGDIPVPSLVQEEMENGEAERLTVLSCTPSGVELLRVAEVTIQFSEPMVPLESVRDSSELSTGISVDALPVEISPSPNAGQWIWLDPCTLQLNNSVDYRPFPGSTAFCVRVRAGTKSLLGHHLAEDFECHFATATPSLEHFLPRSDDIIDLRPLMLVRFDQRVSPAAVLESMCFASCQRTDDSTFKSVCSGVLATEQEIAEASDDIVRALDSATKEGRLHTCVLFRPASQLQADTEYAIVFKELPSLEGPLTRESCTKKFRTFAPFTVARESRAGYADAFRPTEPWRLILSNVLHSRTCGENDRVALLCFGCVCVCGVLCRFLLFFTLTGARVFVLFFFFCNVGFTSEQALLRLAVSSTPPIPHLYVSAAGTRLTVHGMTEPNTTYLLDLSLLEDKYGQRLVAKSSNTEQNPSAITFEVEEAEPDLHLTCADAQISAIMDPALPPVITVITRNQPFVKVRLLTYDVSLCGVPPSPGWLHSANGQVGPVFASFRVDIDSVRDEDRRVRIDLTEYLVEYENTTFFVEITPARTNQRFYGERRCDVGL
jgi:hypothetical protein